MLAANLNKGMSPLLYSCIHTSVFILSVRIFIPMFDYFVENYIFGTPIAISVGLVK